MNIRITEPSDHATLAEWIEKDEDHRGRCTPEYFSDKSQQCFSVEDVMFVRAERVLRLHIQFPPDQHRKLVKTIDEFTKWVKETAKKEGFTQIIFESRSEPLIKFLEKRGFRKSTTEVVYDIS